MLETPTLIMRGRALIHARSRHSRSGDAGTVTIHATRIMLSDRAQISASSRGDGSSGILSINATESITREHIGRAHV